MTVFTNPNFATTDLFELIGIFTLLALLILKELSTSSDNHFAHIFNQILNIAIVPLFLAFALIVIIKIANAL
jgi:hypothetical protein